MNIGLAKDDIAKIISIIKSDKMIEQAYLFGSRAKGNYENGSDIDIAIKGENLNLHNILDLQVEYNKLNLPYKLDIVIFDRINEQNLIEHIDRVGINIISNS
ncbi:MAG: nucleotidyltransferase domain-containing protein [Melioribacteraceae bacterium]|nr:nucleotidyltransferase domain-containing protein [Melioribacteraceae bacterium]